MVLNTHHNTLINNKKGMGEYFWYILFFTVIALTLFGFKLIGGDLFSQLQDDTHLRNTLTNERIILSLKDTNSLGEKISRSIPLTENTLSDLFSKEQSIAIKISKDSQVFYLDEENFVRMNERVPIVNEKRTTILDDGTIIEVIQSLS